MGRLCCGSCGGSARNGGPWCCLSRPLLTTPCWRSCGPGFKSPAACSMLQVPSSLHFSTSSLLVTKLQQEMYADMICTQALRRGLTGLHVRRVTFGRAAWWVSIQLQCATCAPCKCSVDIRSWLGFERETICAARRAGSCGWAGSGCRTGRCQACIFERGLCAAHGAEWQKEAAESVKP